MKKEAWNALVDRYIEKQNEKVGKPVVLSDSIPSSFPQAHRHVSAEVIRDYALNIGDSNPLYTDEEYAGKTRWGGIIAPPGRFVNYIAETGSFARDQVPPGVNFLYGGTDYKFNDVIRAGDSFTIRDEYLGIEEKKLAPEKAEKYRLMTMRSKRDYINQYGKIVVSATGTVMLTAVYPGAAARRVFARAEKTVYTQEELDRLYRYYDDYNSGKYTRGSRIRYWETVHPGEEIDVLYKGPNDVTDMAAWASAIGEVLGNSGTKWASIKALPVDRDSETGAWISRDAFHYSDRYAWDADIPAAMVYGALIEAYVCEAISDWCGDDGFVRAIEIQQRKPAYHGDLLAVSGVVSEKFQAAGRHLVKLALTVRNQRDELLVKGAAEIELLSMDSE